MGISSIYSKIKSEKSQAQSAQEKDCHTLIMRPIAKPDRRKG